MSEKETKKEENEVEEIKGKWVVQQVATQTQPVIYNEKEEKKYDIGDALVVILNKLEYLESKL